jgi:bifunctional DNase/RNase
MRVIFVKIALFFIFEANGSQIKECIFKNSIISIITTPSMCLVKLNIKGISYSQTQNGAYALILIEVDGDRQLPIVIGAFEAQSIAIALEKEIKPPRPLTHDLFKNFADRFDIVVKQVIIHKLVDGVFFSSIICERDKIEEIIDARTSDAIALAIRFNAPIFTYKNILDKAGIFLKINPAENEEIENSDTLLNAPETISTTEDVVASANNYSGYSIKELYDQLETAVQNEDYEKAAKIRDAISKKES